MRNVKELGLRRTINIVREMKKTDIGHGVWERVKNGNIEMRINTKNGWWDWENLKHLSVDDGIGYTFQGTNQSFVFATASPDYAALARTIIHEGVHASGIQMSKKAEFLARVAEIYARGRAPKLSELRDIRRIAFDPHGNYGDLVDDFGIRISNGLIYHRFY
ncbi:MAG: hypothetical protein KDK30_04565 [Leptospiraceae bacterium]|nr:hypothetical protein [Leptospiraceae bacterium]MCB1314551.1 hypothetical protein [Leptospiraceae bacterium]